MVGTTLMFVWTTMLLILWGFAFFPVPQTSPEWIIQTQAACFGTLSNGLPAFHGWIILILSPIAVLSVVWAACTEEIYAIPGYIKKSKVSKMLLLLLLPMLMLVAHWTGKRLTYAYRLSKIDSASSSVVQNPLPIDYLRLSRMVPSFELINQNGEKINQEVFRGKVTLLTFAFAHCSSICPVIIRDVLTAQNKIGSQDLQSIIITLDPWRDTPSTLESAAKSWSITNNGHMLSGDTKAVEKVLEGFEIKSIRNPKNGDINHAAQAMVVNRKGQVVYSFLNPSVDWLTSAAARLLNE